MRRVLRAVLQQPEDGSWLAYEDAAEIFQAGEMDEVLPALRAVEDAAYNGLTAVGFLSYEAAGAFDPAMRTRPRGALPLVWFAAFESCRPISFQRSNMVGEAPRLDWSASLDRDTYRYRVERIRRHIADGDTYQVNYTFRLRAPFKGDVDRLFRHLVSQGDARYGAIVDIGQHAICSLSPELFFQLQGESLLTRPMKGTAERGRTTAEDAQIAARLSHSAKNRAENVMIVDMMRNDLGRIARAGDVEVPNLWEIERYRTLFQMTSTCRASTDAPITEILAALFPSASITGAPKIRTMELISELEDSPRGIYTGAVGRIGPGRSTCLNVAIRTVHVDRQAGEAEYGTGGGIVWDSVADDEFEEARSKALVVTDCEPPFSLFETLRWDAHHGFVLLERHLDRLLDSATYFGWLLERRRLERQLSASAETFDRPMRVRLLVTPDGGIDVRSEPLEHGARRWRVALAARPVDASDRFLYHKTTHRVVYELARTGRSGVDDVILWNERGELTESTVANLVVRKGDDLLTPPVGCGLLAGTLRADLIARRRIREEILRREDLAGVEALFLINSVRGWIPASLVDSAETPPTDPS